MSPLLQAALASILRKGLTVLATFLVTHGIWTHGEATEYVAGLTLFLLSIGWSAWKTYKDRLKFLTALQVPAGTSEATVNRLVGTGTGATLSATPGVKP